MKLKYIRALFIIAMAAFAATSCYDDSIRPESIFKDEDVRYTEFDAWLQRNYTDPYNVRFEYRMPDRETSFGYWVSPPDIDKAIMIAKTLKYTTIEAMVEMMTTDDEDKDPALFVKQYFPKVIYLVGCFEISSSGTVALASAENGLQINILGANFFEYQKDAERIAGTMLHEFTHILDGIHTHPEEYNQITPSDYVGDRYTSLTEDPLKKGFISNYGRSSIAEDVAEVGGRVISSTPEEWEQIYAAAGPDGGAKLRKKHDLIVSWLRDSYGVDANRWSKIYLDKVKTLDTINWDSLDD
ncbi:MAG: putative zinc-binding metallopeptidase [Bacteroidales bacterium]|nr:putative zinc-binding metallopeptidase [Bacteroidales bacterium]